MIKAMKAMLLVGGASSALAFAPEAFLTGHVHAIRSKAGTQAITMKLSNDGIEQVGVAALASGEPSPGQSDSALKEEAQEVEMVSSSPRWPGDKGLEGRDGVFLRPKRNVVKLQKEWINGRYVTKSATVDRQPVGVKFPANLPFFRPKDLKPTSTVATAPSSATARDMEAAKGSAAILALLLLLAQPIVQSGYYSVDNNPNDNNFGYVTKVDKIGEFKETVGDTLEQYVKGWLKITAAENTVPTSYYQSLKARDPIDLKKLQPAKKAAAAPAGEKSAPAAASAPAGSRERPEQFREGGLQVDRPACLA